ncbi:MAG: o-succinylbenzoate synthase [Candidatus Uhrbacteria bacterium]|nr:o-succinylbenzoate synthase [Candidatus Uhrbacteria bacterium]
MKIHSIELLKLALPMIHSFETSFGRLEHTDTVIVKLTTNDGIVGFGESPTLHAPLYNPETADTAMLILEKFLAPSVIGKEFSTPDEFRASYANIIGNHTAKTGLECAFWHAYALKQKKSLKELFGGVRDVVPVGESIGIKSSVEETIDEIAQRLAEGYVRIKVKIKPGWDVSLTAKIRERYPSIPLMLDGNSAYSLEKHLDILKTLDQFNLMMIEQPLAEDDIIDHATLQKELATPICLDESIKSAEDARKAIQIGACKIINIKPGRVGGIVESINIHNIAQKHSVGVWCGGLLESGIGRAFNIAIASKENYIYPADMSPYHHFYQEDLIEPSYIVKQDGTIDVPIEPGLGYTIQEDRIKKYTTTRVMIAA